MPKTRTTASAGVEECAALLKRSYEGEIIGTAMYESLLDVHVGARREALALLRDIESATANALAPLLEKYGVDVDEVEARREGHRLAARLKDRRWKHMWRDVIDMADEYLHDFERLVQVLDAEDAAIGRQVVEHEVSLIEFARLECAVDRSSSLAPLRDHLAKYGSTS